MSRRTSLWLPAVLAFCLLAPCLLDVVPAQGAAGGKSAGVKTRVVPIPGTGLALRVPRGVAVGPEYEVKSAVTNLWVEVDDMRTFEGDGVIGREDVLAQQAALARGEAEVAEGWEEGEAELVSLPTGGYAVTYPWYSQFEYCSIQFTMNAAFFVNNRRVILRYNASPAVITRENPAYFKAMGENDRCETLTIWKQPGDDDDDHVLERFHVALKAGRLGPVATAWYADFNAMLASLHRRSPKR